MTAKCEKCKIPILFRKYYLDRMESMFIDRLNCIAIDVF